MIASVWLRGPLLLAVTLVAGIVIGVAYERQRRPAHEAERASHHVMQVLSPELGLDSVQAQTVSRILAHHQGAVDSSWHAVQPHVRATLDSAFAEILAVLRPDQAAKFRRMVRGH